MADRNACLTDSGFWILIGFFLVIGVLGVIISSIAINHTNKLKKIDKKYKKSIWFLVTMLVIFILILIGSTIYGIALFQTRLGTPLEIEKWIRSSIPSVSLAYPRRGRQADSDIEMFSRWWGVKFRRNSFFSRIGEKKKKTNSRRNQSDKWRGECQ